MSKPITYTTSQGQTWDEIAHQIWGVESMMHHLMAANPQYRRVQFFRANVVLVVPFVTVPVNEEPPPWQQL